MEPLIIADSGFQVRTAIWDESGGGTWQSELNPRSLPKLPNGSVGWIDLTPVDSMAATKTLAMLGVPEFMVERFFSQRTQTDVEPTEDALFSIVARCRNLDELDETTPMLVGLVGNWLLTLSLQQDPVLEATMNRQVRRPNWSRPSLGQLVHEMVDGLVDPLFDQVDVIEDRLDDIDEAIHLGRRVHIQSILIIKRHITQMRRIVLPIRDLLNAILRGEAVGTVPSDRSVMQDSYDYCLRLVERLDINRDLASEVVQAHQNEMANQLNKNVQFLTVVSTVIMSISLISGIYGMNFTNMPELRHPWGYFIILGVMLFVAILEIIYFKLRRWF